MIFLKRFMGNSSGATAIEYALIDALITIAIIGAVMALGTEVNEASEAVSAAQEQ